MAITMGMNPDEVEQMGHSMQKQADNITQTVIPHLDALVNKIPGDWSGKDATEFQGWWHTHRSQLQKAASELHGLGQSALNNASAQRDASGR